MYSKCRQNVPELKKQYPGIELQVMEAKSDELLNALLRDDISFYVIPRSQGELPVGLKAESIYRERLLLVAEKSMIQDDMFLGTEQAADRMSLSPTKLCLNLNALKDIPFIMLKKGHAIRKKQTWCCASMESSQKS